MAGRALSRPRATALLPLVAFALLLVPAAGARPPAWLQQEAARSARTLSDGTKPVSVTYVAPRSRFPRVVLEGSFVCNNCTGPLNAPPPQGTYAAMRYDGKTHVETDFALCKKLVQCLASLCNGVPCTQANLLFDAGVRALQQRLGDAPAYRQGTFKCHVDFSSDDMRYAIGSCTERLRILGPHSALLRYTKRWRRELRHGRWVDVPLRTHTWRVLVTGDGWRTQITSRGDPLPVL